MRLSIFFLNLIVLFSGYSQFATSEEVSGVYVIKNKSFYDLGIRYLDEDNFFDSKLWQAYSKELEPDDDCVRIYPQGDPNKETVNIYEKGVAFLEHYIDTLGKGNDWSFEPRYNYHVIKNVEEFRVNRASNERVKIEFMKIILVFISYKSLKTVQNTLLIKLG